MPSCNTYRLTWVSLTLGVGYLFTAASAKCSHCSLPWTRGISSNLFNINEFILKKKWVLGQRELCAKGCACAHACLCVCVCVCVCVSLGIFPRHSPPQIIHHHGAFLKPHIKQLPSWNLLCSIPLGRRSERTFVWVIARWISTSC